MPILKGKVMKVIKSSIFNPISKDKFDYFETGALVIDDNGRISSVGDYNIIIQGLKSFDLIDKSDYYLLPGMIDTHVHLPQFEAKAVGKGELLDWLNNYIFPLEEKFADKDFARDKSKQFFDELLKKGTTTASIYSANIQSATEITFEEAEKIGIRAFIGNSLMDFGGESELFKSTEENIKIIEYFTQKWHKKTNLLHYILTPRFAGSSSAELMKFCSEFSMQNDLLIQTHLSENLSEIQFMLGIYPQNNSYTEIYDTYGILSDKTLLAHCIHLSDEEIEIIKSRNCSICHCPSSNRFLESGIMPFAKYTDRNINIALGSDVAGGYSVSIFNEAKEAKEMSKLLKVFNKGENHRNVSISEVFFAATLGGAKALHIENETGNFANGKTSDFVLIKKDKYIDRQVFTSNENILSDIFYSTFDVDETIINGTTVYKS